MIPRRLLLSALSCLLVQAAPPAFQTGRVRVQVLSPSLVRLEVATPQGGFEDRPTFRVVDRDWPGAEATRQDAAGVMAVAGPGWTLEVAQGAADLKSARVLDKAGHVLWSCTGAETASAWLPGPADHPGAWAVADAPRLVPPAWRVAPDPEGRPAAGWDLGVNAPDLYVFLPGGDYARLRQDVEKLTGPAELPPLYAFGLFHSRYWPYSDREALDLVDQYRRRGFPLDVLVVDTDWRVGASTGYGENQALFPDMAGFLAKAHAAGVKVMFNDHPEPQAARALDGAELGFRFEGLSRWLRAGLDVWWYDRNWSSSLVEPLPGLHKEVWGMALYHDMTRQAVPGRRPLIMANVDGIDNGHRSDPPDLAAHRYPIQWTGDTLSDWPWLAHAVDNALFEGVHGLNPYVGEDLTGHIGTPSLELYLRFLEFGTLSPTLRLHSSNSPAFRREPWAFGPEGERVAREYVRLRYRLLPALYAAARRAYDTGEPLLRRLDLRWPAHPEARRPDQYLLGEDLLVAPIIQGEPSTPKIPKALLHAPDGAPGLRTDYFTTPDPAGTPALTRTEGTLDLAGIRNRPETLPAGPFSASWTGTITPDRPLQVGLLVDQQARLYLDGQLLLDRWNGGPWSQLLDPSRTLEPGRTYALRVDFRSPDGSSRCRLFGRYMDVPAPQTREVWIPEGTWVDLWTGERLQGPRTVKATAALDQVPMYLREGSILPLASGDGASTAAPWAALALEIHPGPASATELYEDDGASEAYRTGAFRRTRITQELDPATGILKVAIAAVEGSFPGAPALRSWTVRIKRPAGSPPPAEVRVDGNPCRNFVLLPRKAGMPLGVRGPAPDGDVLEIPLEASGVERERTVEVR